MMISETVNLSASITLKDGTGTDIIVAYVTTSLDGGTENFNIALSVQNKVLLDTAGATNTVGETAAQQYTEFETAVKARAKELGYVIFA
ncbi:hypothetical protein SAMN02745134_00788 [Clostridium acidisoli DSM 12555]|uniref:Uncharacterized protein n=1 Tax=Clostridium acidisoli DSM 12555 TaxID=1121291 RepID=A0A1W1X5T7_9CLOT|nr:hypothetical protein [Clostridium acidisoli]SMC19286.1 hypothetical protein SAMN02745134_00788 [Clostridium acidisoli DSM 12555]